ncbi:hypothetical protein K438DRAFT_1972394 [Mycena galopus ATCC 62051]|nr:hypothetical protein K438DRAFT_1972394 [Mycena galopus ATCC 62051]
MGTKSACMRIRAHPEASMPPVRILLVAITAGRIWLKLREAIHIGTYITLKNRYHTVFATIVESGVLYCSLAILIVILEVQPSTASSDITFAIEWASAQLINIIPTLIIVRAGMGHNIQDKIEPPRAPRTTPARSVVHREHSSDGVLDLKPGSEKEATANYCTLV